MVEMSYIHREYILNTTCTSLLLLILTTRYFIFMLTIDIGYLYLILTTLFSVPTFMLSQSLAFNSSNEIVYGIAKYAYLLDINVTPLSVLWIIDPL